jgi:hypothetical protein
VLTTKKPVRGTKAESPMSSIIQRLGFQQPQDVSGHLSIAELYPKSKKRCGIYLLHFLNDLCYIGQASDFVRRFGQHRAKHTNIAGISFLPITRNVLDLQEKQMICKAEKLGLRLTNKVFVSSVAGETDLDVLLPPTAQERWLKSPTDFRPEDPSLRVSPLPNQRLRYSAAFEALRRRKDAAVVLDIARAYLRGAVPAPSMTEYSFWSVSCMPSTHASTAPRLLCFSMNKMETMALGHWKDLPSESWGFVNVSRSVLSKAFPDEDAFRKAFRGAEWGEPKHKYQAAGEDQLTIEFYRLDTAQRLFRDQRILKAAAELNLRLMRKGGNIYAQYHCFDLADSLLDRKAKH